MSAVGIILRPTLPQAPSAGQTFTVTFNQGPAWSSQDDSSKPLFYAVQFQITGSDGKALSSSPTMPGIANLGDNDILPWDKTGEFILPADETLCSSTAPSAVQPGSFSYTWDSSTWKAGAYRLAIKQATYSSENMFSGAGGPAENGAEEEEEGQVLCANAPFAMTTIEKSYPFTLSARNASFVAGASWNRSSTSSGQRLQEMPLLRLYPVLVLSAVIASYIL